MEAEQRVQTLASGSRRWAVFSGNWEQGQRQWRVRRGVHKRCLGCEEKVRRSRLGQGSDRQTTAQGSNLRTVWFCKAKLHWNSATSPRSPGQDGFPPRRQRWAQLGQSVWPQLKTRTTRPFSEKVGQPLVSDSGETHSAGHGPTYALWSKLDRQ